MWVIYILLFLKIVIFVLFLDMVIDIYVLLLFEEKEYLVEEIFFDVSLFILLEVLK